MTPKFDLLVEKIDITDDKRNIINRMDSIDKIDEKIDRLQQRTYFQE